MESESVKLGISHAPGRWVSGEKSDIFKHQNSLQFRGSLKKNNPKQCNNSISVNALKNFTIDFFASKHDPPQKKTKFHDPYLSSFSLPICFYPFFHHSPAWVNCGRASPSHAKWPCKASKMPFSPCFFLTKHSRRLGVTVLKIFGLGPLPRMTFLFLLIGS